jgi:hypothetical protein
MTVAGKSIKRIIAIICEKTLPIANRTMPGTSIRAIKANFNNVNLNKVFFNETNTFLTILKKSFSGKDVNETVNNSKIVINIKTTKKLIRRIIGPAKNLSLGNMTLIMYDGTIKITYPIIKKTILYQTVFFMLSDKL